MIATTVIEACLAVEVRVRNDGCPLAEAAGATGIGIDARPPQRRSDGYDLLRFDAPRSPELTEVLDGDDRISYLHVSRTDGRNRYRCLSREPCVVHALIDRGLIVEGLRYEPEATTVSGSVVGREVLEGVMEVAGEAVGVTLERAYPLEAEAKEASGRRWDLTPAQEDCVRTALEMGYFEIPRATSSEAVAAELGIGKSAFLERLRRAETALIEGVFGRS